MSTKVIQLLVTFLLLFNFQALAATEFEDNIPIEVARGLLGLGSADAGVYSDILDDFPSFDLPEDFTVLGS